MKKVKQTVWITVGNAPFHSHDPMKVLHKKWLLKLYDKVCQGGSHAEATARITKIRPVDCHTKPTNWFPFKYTLDNNYMNWDYCITTSLF